MSIALVPLRCSLIRRLDWPALGAQKRLQVCRSGVDFTRCAHRHGVVDNSKTKRTLVGRLGPLMIKKRNLLTIPHFARETENGE